MPATNSKPTPEELNQAKQLYNDVNDYLEYLSEAIQSKVDSEDSEDSDNDEELSPIVSQFLQDYKEYAASSHAQFFDSDSLGSSKKSFRLPKRLLKYSKTFQALQLLSPDLLCDQKLCETKLDCDAQVETPSFSAFPAPDDDRSENEKLLTNGSPSVALLKAQLEKDAREREKNYIFIRSPIYVPFEEKKFVFVVKKSTDVIATAPPLAVELPKQEPVPVKEEIKENDNSTIEDEKSEVVKEILSGKKPKKSALDRDLLSSFLAIAKVGFSKSQISQLSQLCTVAWPY